VAKRTFWEWAYAQQIAIAEMWCHFKCGVLKMPPKPKYEPAKWGGNDTYGVVCWNNNCYNYACDLRTDTFAQPGEASGQKWTLLECPNVTVAAVSDGLATHPDASQSGDCCHTVALVMAPGDDYHWYRKDASGLWSHKPGHTPVKNVDESNSLITDPLTADRGIYTQFCGYFTVCKCDVKIT
jgi:hypothetical protein